MRETADVESRSRSFGSSLRALRERAGLTQETLARRAGLSTNAISALERGTRSRPYPRTVAVLAEALGLNPAERAALERSVSRPAGRIPCPAAPEHPRPAAALPTPRQLPAATRHFVGRADVLARLDALLTAPGHSASGSTAIISAIGGTAGVGKTTLAVHWAHQVAERFSDGQLYVNLRGFDPSGSMMSSAEAVRGFLDALQVPAGRIPASPSAQVGLYRSLLAGRRVLIVLDNAGTADQVRPLLPGSPGCLVVVTSRHQLTSLVAVEGAQPLTLDLLTADEARQLLSHRLGPGRVAAEPAAVEEIIAACARLPLALAVVAARAATRPGLPLTALAARLRQACGDLDAFDGGDAVSSVRAVFSWSYDTLSGAAARLFRLLGLHPGPDFAEPAAASLAGVRPAQVRRLLAELAGARLLTEDADGRYAFHDLLRAYAAELANRIDDDAARRAATSRVLDHYLHTAYAAAVLLDPHRVPITLPPARPGVVVTELAGHRQAQAWFATEHAVLLAAVDQAADADLSTHAWQLAWALTDFLDRQGHWHDLAATHHAVLAVTRRSADRLGQAWANRAIGLAYTQLGHQDPHPHLQRAVDLFDQIGDRTGQASTHNLLAWMCERRGRHEEALSHSQNSLRLCQTAGHTPGQASALNNVGWYYAQLGDHQQALIHCEQALSLHQQTGDRPGQGTAWDSLGYTHHNLGNHDQAATCYRHALGLFREIGDRYEEASTLDHLGDTHRAAGHPKAAGEAWQQSLDILKQLGHPTADEVRAKLADVTTPATTQKAAAADIGTPRG